MSYRDALRAGRLLEALSSLQELVRVEPAISKHRMALFELLVVLGDWNRALKQLDVLRNMDSSTLAMVHAYHAVIACECLRTEVFSGKIAPVFIGEPAGWQALLIQVLPLLATGHYQQANELKQQAFYEAPALRGTLNGESFEWLADTDSRLGPTLEVISDGGYRWVALEQVQTLILEKPVDLRDLVWLPAQIRWVTGGETTAFIPTRYPNSHTRSDNLALGRATEWEQIAKDFYVGFGQRMFASNLADHAFLEPG